jgi:hypothetical protein
MIDGISLAFLTDLVRIEKRKEQDIVAYSKRLCT